MLDGEVASAFCGKERLCRKIKKMDIIAPLLTIAGFDPSSGAGITADLQVFAAHRRFGTACITALTVQSTQGVEAVHAVPVQELEHTLECLQKDLPPSGIKIGMLADEGIVRAVAAYLRKLQPRPIVVLDTVLRSSSGAYLLQPSALEAFQNMLLPQVDWITPNWLELETLAEMSVTDRSTAIQAADALGERYPSLNMVVTGGAERPPHDYVRPAHGQPFWLPGEHIETRATHGTGCAFSSSFLCELAAGKSATTASAAAKHYVAQAMQQAHVRGSGHGPMHLLWPMTTAY